MTLFNLKIDSLKNTCESAEYFFKGAYTNKVISIDESLLVDVQGGVAPYTWTADANGTFANGSTIGKTNTLTCDSMPSSGRLSYTVVDSCGKIVTGYITVVEYNPGNDCTITS